MIQAVTLWSFHWRSPFQPFSPGHVFTIPKRSLNCHLQIINISEFTQTLKLNHQKTVPHLLQFLLNSPTTICLISTKWPPARMERNYVNGTGELPFLQPNPLLPRKSKSWESPRSCTIQIITTIVQRKTDPSWLLPSKHRSDPSPTKEVVGRSRPRPQQNGLWFFC